MIQNDEFQVKSTSSLFKILLGGTLQTPIFPVLGLQVYAKWYLLRFVLLIFTEKFM